MNKTLLASIISGGILLTGCDDKSIDSTSSGDVDSPVVSFAPLSATPVLSTPNDLLISTSGPLAGRLGEIPGQTTADVYAATAQLDGWGLTTPFTIGIELPESGKYQTTLRASSVEQAGAVYIFKCAEGTAVATQNCAPATITSLTYGVDYSLTATSDGILVTPLKPLEANTGYFLGVTDMVKDSYGQSVTRSATFDTYSKGTGSNSAAEQSLNGLLSGTNTLLANFTGMSADDFMYSATWTTQDVDTTAKAVMNKIVTDASAITSLTNTGLTVRDVLAANFGITFDDQSPEAFVTGNTAVWAGTLDLPYYLPFPGLPDDGNAAIPDNGLTCNFSPICGNWLNAQSQSPWKGSAAPVEASDGLTSLLKPNEVNVQLLIPNATLIGHLSTQTPAITEVRVVQYVHGITSVKETAFTISPALASAGFAVIAIDQPLHGSRSFDANGDNVYEITATSPSNGAAYANGDSAVFANLASLLTARDNLRQATSDQLALRWAIAHTDFSAANGPDNSDDISLLGVSLGSIVGTAAQGMSEIHSDDSFKFTASALSVGGSQVGPILGYSDSFGPITQASLVGTTSFTGATGGSLGYGDITINPGSGDIEVPEAVLIQAATGDTYGKAAQTALGMTAAQAQYFLNTTEAQAQAEFGSMIKLAYPSFLKGFINGAQAVVDGGDSAIWATKTTNTPTLAHQVIGDGTVPNDVLANGYPLAGTYGWLNALDLEQQSTTTQDLTGLRVYASFTAGSHGSALDPGASQAATTEMQTQIAKFLASQGTALVVTDSSVVE